MTGGSKLRFQVHRSKPAQPFLAPAENTWVLFNHEFQTGPGDYWLGTTDFAAEGEVWIADLSLREAYADTVRSLVAALEAKDPYTKGHSVRVAGFAVAIAKAISLDEREVQNIEYAALLHDLGKIGISRSLLSKADALTPEEYERIREHPAIAARILESVPFLAAVLPAVRDHHERLDGRGYGGGVQATDLSQAARILAVADSYDAMTADRPYRAALQMEAAIEELRANAGTQFDPQIVEAFLEVLPLLDSEWHAAAEFTEGDAAVEQA